LGEGEGGFQRVHVVIHLAGVIALLEADDLALAQVDTGDDFQRHSGRLAEKSGDVKVPNRTNELQSSLYRRPERREEMDLSTLIELKLVAGRFKDLDERH